MWVVLSQTIGKSGHRNRVNILFLTRKKKALKITVFIAEIIMHRFWDGSENAGIHFKTLNWCRPMESGWFGQGHPQVKCVTWLQRYPSVRCSHNLTRPEFLRTSKSLSFPLCLCILHAFNKWICLLKSVKYLWISLVGAVSSPCLVLCSCN